MQAYSLCAYLCEHFSASDNRHFFDSALHRCHFLESLCIHGCTHASLYLSRREITYEAASVSCAVPLRQSTCDGGC